MSRIFDSRQAFLFYTAYISAFMESNNSKLKNLKRYITEADVNISVKDKKVNLFNFQKFKYVLFGGANVLLNWVLFYLIFHYVTFKNNVVLFYGAITISPYIFALLLSFAITFFTGFLANFYLVFGKDEHAPKFGNRLLRYFATNMGSLTINYFLLKLFVDVFVWYPTPSQILCTCIITVYSYLAQRKFTFSKRF